MQPTSRAPRTIARRRDRHRQTPIALVVSGACMGSVLSLPACLLSIDDGLVGRAADASTSDGTTGGDVAQEGDVWDSGAATDADAAEAEAGCPPAMVQVPVPGPGGGKDFCVDSTEATNKAYRAFLAAAEPPAAGSQITACAWNATYTVGTLGADDLPVGGLDWCDAYAFCAWTGKRLCGAVAGGALAYGPFPSMASRWYVACSHGGANAFPYGNTYDPLACNGKPLDAGGPLPVGSLASCEGGYAGLFDMSGNVSEFIDSCDTTPIGACGSSGPECDLCLLVGGGFLSGQGDGGNIACTYPNQIYRNAHYVDNGVRCCADLP